MFDDISPLPAFLRKIAPLTLAIAGLAACGTAPPPSASVPDASPEENRAAAPELVAPELVAPELAAPELAAPESAAPESAAPESTPVALPEPQPTSDPATPPDASAQAAPAPLTGDRLGLNDLRVGDPASALDFLGEPLEELNDLPPGNYDTYREVRYPTLEVAIGDDRIAMMVTRSPDWATPDGVRVGDSRERVVERYGLPADPGNPNVPTPRLSYYVPEDGSYLVFEFEDDKVATIAMGWLPD